jgi:ssDNA-binding Zn-finger/Zn-ribbon topoisomerase 1
VGIILVKEKLGGLRIYTEYYDAELEKTITEVGKESFHICEHCGMTGGLRKLDGQYFTACDQHSKGATMIQEPWY